MQNDNFISSVRAKINTKKKRKASIFYSVSILSVFVLTFYLQPIINSNSTLIFSSTNALDGHAIQEYILTEEDILIYLIEELDVDEFLSMSIDGDLFNNFNLNDEGI